MPVCDICNRETVKARVVSYSSCVSCGHESKIAGFPEDVFIINDALNLKSIQKIDQLEKFKKKVLKKIVTEYGFLLDVGSASGKFLYLNKDDFTDHLGLEITPECVKFSREVLGLKIAASIEGVNLPKISVATFWHSLEHLPINILQGILEKISLSSNDKTKILISVPNAKSALYRHFGHNYAFFDASSHVHQFTRDSLEILLKRHKFELQKSFFSFVYSFFGYLQTFINCGNVHHNFLYYFLKRGNCFGLKPRKLYLIFFYNILLSVIFTVPALIGVAYDAVFKQKGAVLTLCFRMQKP